MQQKKPLRVNISEAKGMGEKVQEGPGVRHVNVGDTWEGLEGDRHWQRGSTCPLHTRAEEGANGMGKEWLVTLKDGQKHI